MNINNSTTAGIIDSYKEYSLTAQQLADIVCHTELEGIGSDSEQARQILRATQHQSLLAILRAQERTDQITMEIELTSLDPEFFHGKTESRPRTKTNSRETVRLHQVELYSPEGSEYSRPRLRDIEVSTDGEYRSQTQFNHYPSLEDGFLLFCFSLFGTIAAFFGTTIGAELSAQISSPFVASCAHYFSIVFTGFSGGITGLVFGLLVVLCIKTTVLEIKDYAHYRTFVQAQRGARA
jgi:hypothetical protein